MALTAAKGVRLPVRASRTAVKVMAVARPQAKAARAGLKVDQMGLLATAAILLQAAPAKAQETIGVDSAVDAVISAVKVTGDIVKAGISAVEAGIEVAKEGYEVAAPVVEKAVKAATPVVEQAVKVTGEVAGPAFNAALPAIQGTVNEASKAVKSAEVTSVVTKTATDGANAVTPFLTKFINFLAASEPLALGEYALGVVAIYYLSPVFLGLISGSLRGFAGDLTAASALDSVVNDNSTVMIDIRTVEEKEKSGVPDVPSSSSGKVLEVEYAVTTDKKLRGQLRDPSGIEAQVTALQIASLKKISKGTKIILLDRYGPAARNIAKELARKGYSKVYVISGGFDGRNGWVQSKLQIKPAAGLVVAAPSLPFTKTITTRTVKSLPSKSSA